MRTLRDGRRRAGLTLAAGITALAGLSACEPPPPVLSLTVVTSADGADAQPGDGVCEATAGGGDCTLRAALTEANATGGPDVVTLAPGVHPTLSLAGSGEDANATGDLDVTGDVTLRGGGATLDAAGLDRALDVLAGRLTVEDLTVTGGDAPEIGRTGWGSGARVTGSLATRRVRFEGNVTANGQGAAISMDGGALDLVDTWVGDNAPPDPSPFDLSHGVVANGGFVLLNRSTIEAVTGDAVSGYGTRIGIADSTLRSPRTGLSVSDPFEGPEASALVIRSTLVQQVDDSLYPPWLVYGGGAPVLLYGSVVDAPGRLDSTGLCYGDVSSGGWTVARDASCGLAAEGDLPDAPALLNALADNGGPTPTMLPSGGSPVLDRIPAGTPILCPDGGRDQRGEPRPVGDACDAGSVEGRGPMVVGAAMTVDAPVDAADADPGDGTCATVGGQCTLRAALQEASATNPDLPDVLDTITIGAGIDPTLSVAGRDEDGGATGDLDVAGAVRITGGGAVVDAAGLDRVLHSSGPLLELRDLTVTGGRAVGGDAAGSGGGVQGRGTLDLSGVTLRGNEADVDGGGIQVVDRLVASGSTFEGNRAGRDGGGISGGIGEGLLDLETSLVADNIAGSSGGGLSGGSARISRSTFRGNHADVRGGAVGNNQGGLTRIDASTLSGNSAPSGSAIWGGGTLQVGTVLRGSTVTGNTGSAALQVYGVVCTRACYEWDMVSAQGSIIVGTPGAPACDRPVASPSANLAPDGTCGATLAGDPLLGPLADHGGPTPTHLPGPGSGAIDAIAPGTPALCDATTPIDQRGVARPTGPACDVGAAEQ